MDIKVVLVGSNLQRYSLFVFDKESVEEAFHNKAEFTKIVEIYDDCYLLSTERSLVDRNYRYIPLYEKVLFKEKKINYTVLEVIKKNEEIVYNSNKKELCHVSLNELNNNEIIKANENEFIKKINDIKDECIIGFKSIGNNITENIDSQKCKNIVTSFYSNLIKNRKIKKLELEYKANYISVKDYLHENKANYIEEYKCIHYFLDNIDFITSSYNLYHSENEIKIEDSILKINNEYNKSIMKRHDEIAKISINLILNEINLYKDFIKDIYIKEYTNEVNAMFYTIDLNNFKI